MYCGMEGQNIENQRAGIFQRIFKKKEMKETFQKIFQWPVDALVLL